MSWLALTLVIVPTLLLQGACANRRPGLLMIAATFLLAHAVPLIALEFDEAASSELRAYRADAQWIAALATSSFAIGYALVTQRRVTERTTSGHASSSVPWLHGLVMTAALALVLSWPGGLAGLALQGFERLPAESLHFSLTYASASMLGVTTVLLTLSRLRSSKRLPWLSIVAVTLLFWMLGGRAQLFVTIASLALCALAYRRINPGQLALTAGIFALLSVLTLQLRLGIQGDEAAIADIVTRTLAQLSLLDGYAIAARYFETFGAHPAMYLDTVQQIVPRALYPDKPVQISRLLRLMVSRDELGGLTAGIYGEFLLVGGYVAVAVLGLVFASVVAGLDNGWAAIRSRSLPVQTGIVILLPLLCVFTMRAGLDNSVFRLAITLGTLGIVWAFGALIRPAPALLSGGRG